MPSPTHTTGTSTLMWQKSPVHHLTSLHQGEGVAFNEDSPNSPLTVHLQWARHEIADRLGLLMLKSAAKMLMLVFEGGRPSPNSPQVQAYDQAMGLCWAGMTSSMSSSAPGVSMPTSDRTLIAVPVTKTL